MTDAELLDLCSALLESRGARPVPKADPSFTFAGTSGAPHRCASCRHSLTEHGASGECWQILTDCRCGREENP